MYVCMYDVVSVSQQAPYLPTYMVLSTYIQHHHHHPSSMASNILPPFFTGVLLLGAPAVPIILVRPPSPAYIHTYIHQPVSHLLHHPTHPPAYLPTYLPTSNHILQRSRQHLRGEGIIRLEA